MTELEILSDSHPLGIDIEKVSTLYGNRRTVVRAFLLDKSKKPNAIAASELSIFELIELQLGYPIPTKVRKLI